MGGRKVRILAMTSAGRDSKADISTSSPYSEETGNGEEFVGEGQAEEVHEYVLLDSSMVRGYLFGLVYAIQNLFSPVKRQV